MASRKTKDAKVAENEFQFANAIPLQVWRSDGTEMPADDSQYAKVEDGAKPIIEWQNKLGQALARELMPKSDAMYFLQEFPAYYHLRWYQAREERGKNQAKHYYLFGYPEEPGAGKARKYYRSPNHFVPHLLWLIGESQDRGDCACEFCSGSKPITSKSAKAKPAAVVTATQVQQQPAIPVTVTPVPVPTNIASATTPTPKPPVTSSNAKPRSTSRVPTPSQQPIPRDTHAQTAAVHHSEVAPSVPQPSYPTVVAAVQEQHAYPASREQHLHPAIYDSDALFRAGEVVWYKNNNSWRIGMILVSGPTLSIIPFSHPLYQTQEVIKEETDIRPFLAFSIPQINQSLQELRGSALSQIDWQALQERFATHTDPSRREGLAIEATKLAATRVDHCYSTFNSIHDPALQSHDTFGGVFLGAEKMCVGEAIRIKLPREQQDQLPEKGMPVVMIPQRISVSREGGALLFEGSLWRLQHVILSQQVRNPNHAQLPAAVRGEKEFRDSMLQSRGWCVDWVLMNQWMSVDESAIRGRFYETQRLTPILNPAKFQEMLRLQQIDDIQTLLNNRGDSSGPHVGRVHNRAEAVSGAVPPDVSVSLGPGVQEA